MEIEHFERLDQHDASIGLAFDPKRGGTHYRFIVANRDGEITKLEQLVGAEWVLIDAEPPASLVGLVRHRLAWGW